MAKLLSYFQGNDNKKISGGYRARTYKVKPKHLGGGPATNTRIGENAVKRDRSYGGVIKIRLLRTQYANVVDAATGKTVKSKIVKLVDTPANKDFLKRGIIVRGAIIETEAGRAVVTSRPGQDGVLNAVLLK
ncbi:30S ribosomal protein S8e [Thermocladium modestius]|uniref:Small ribosomal subunit protein eS8 n=1 Tax=Thermocladium modestius TaxID=62609 RepID=A0A830GWA2_9CREN|nr:30S ribosomal protein S8e [Thermocladium modestius]GGP20542.1 30S ribosomal protein S8e [Thermocladium modestius]